MKLFKNYNKLIIFGAILLFAFSAKSGVIEDLKQQIKNKEKQVQELETEAQNYKQNIKTTKSAEITLKTQISNIEENISELKFNINITQAKIDKQLLEIEELNLEMAKNAKQILDLKENLKTLLRALEKKDHENILTFILKNENLSTIFNSIKSLEDLNNEIQDKLINVKKLKISLENNLSLADNKKSELENLKNNLSVQNQIANSQKKNKTNLLSQTKNQEKLFQKLLADNQKKGQDILKEISDLEEKLRFTIDPNTIPAERSGLLSWPVKGILTQKYGSTNETGFINDSYNFHNGIDIAASIGTPIMSAKEGVIKAMGDNGSYVYGKWIAVDHENGLVTLYGHLSLISVKIGQKVATGDIIGYMGRTGFATGSHLHFTVYAANTFLARDRWFGLLPLGGSLDPLKYL